jgi:hypothetical protein
MDRFPARIQEKIRGGYTLMLNEIEALFDREITIDEFSQ